MNENHSRKSELGKPNRPKTDSKNGIEDFPGHFALLCLVLAYPVLSLFWRHQYPLWSLESFLFMLSIILLAALIGLLTSACRPWLARMLVAICMALTLVLQFNVLFEWALLLLLCLLGLALAAGKNFRLLAFTVFTALIIGAFLDSRIDRVRNDGRISESGQQPSLVPVVHILLDGFIGPDGLPPQDQPQALREDILGFFRQNGFEIYKRAYSHYSASEDSLVHAFNFSNDSENHYLKSSIFHTGISIPENRYFELLHQRGYTINVYQSDTVEFCEAVPKAVGRCMVYGTPNLETVRKHVSSPLLRFRILAITLFKQSSLIHMFLQKRMWLLSWGVTLYQPDVFDEIGNDLEESRSGAYFAHLLIPHAPFVYRQDCSLEYSSESWERFLPPGLVKNSVGTRAVRYLRYLPQAKCALQEVGRLFDRMRRLDLYDDAIIIVHGDHGSRISLHSEHQINRDKLTPEDYRDLFSTLFAIKLPTGHYREHSETISLNELMNKAVLEITGRSAPDASSNRSEDNMPFIYLSGQFPLHRQNLDIFERQ